MCFFISQFFLLYFIESATYQRCVEKKLYLAPDRISPSPPVTIRRALEMCDFKLRTLSEPKVKFSPLLLPFATVQMGVVFGGRSPSSFPRGREPTLERSGFVFSLSRLSSFSFFSLHFAATLAEKRIKSGNEGCKAAGSFLPRQSHSTGSFALSLRGG